MDTHVQGILDQLATTDATIACAFGRFEKTVHRVLVFALKRRRAQSPYDPSLSDREEVSEADSGFCRAAIRTTHRHFEIARRATASIIGS